MNCKNRRIPIFAASLIQVFALCRRLANQQGGCARIFLVFYVFALWTLSAGRFYVHGVSLFKV